MEKSEVRIVAGSLRGRKIVCQVHEGMRPTPQMVREALFSILGNAIPGRPFYDIFAGTGVNGFEAVSRGATEARMIEKDPKLTADILKYAVKFGVVNQIQVLRADVYRWAERWMVINPSPVNLFLSPPFPDLDEAKLDGFLGVVRTLWAKAPPESVMVIQAEDNFPVASVPDPDQWDVRTYGRNLLLIRVKEEVAGPSLPGEPGT